MNRGLVSTGSADGQDAVSERERLTETAACDKVIRRDLWWFTRDP
ncbi:MAG: hypothetical protein ACJAYU_005115 [Bradymonadia bacterium]|jgi:hypothetical protein